MEHPAAAHELIEGVHLQAVMRKVVKHVEEDVWGVKPL